MAFLTTAYALATDIRAGIAHLETLFGARGEVVLAGHSAGGGLVQIVCDQELARVQALALLAGIPSFGAWVTGLPMVGNCANVVGVVIMCIARGGH